MKYIDTILLALWLIIGAVTLRREKVHKWDYTMCWIVMLMQTLRLMMR